MVPNGSTRGDRNADNTEGADDGGFFIQQYLVTLNGSTGSDRNADETDGTGDGGSFYAVVFWLDQMAAQEEIGTRMERMTADFNFGERNVLPVFYFSAVAIKYGQ